MNKAYRIFCGVWIGTIVFFSGVIAPQVFKFLPKAEAASLQNHLFPFYYLVGIACGLLTIPLSLFLKKKTLWYLAIAATLAAVGLLILSPMIREAYLAQSDSMRWLHPLAVFLNIVMFICVLIAV